MEKENYILSDLFVDFQLFPIPQVQSDDFLLTSKEGASTLVIVQQSNFTETEATLLHNILKAAKIEIGQQANLLKITEKAAFKFTGLPTITQIDYLLLFGIPASRIGVQAQIAPYTPTKLQEKFILSADALDRIGTDKQLKLALWNALKILYKID